MFNFLQYYSSPLRHKGQIAALLIHSCEPSLPFAAINANLIKLLVHFVDQSDSKNKQKKKCSYE